MSENRRMLGIVANGLGDLLPQVVFVGGATSELYADHPELSEIRVTDDVDCVVEMASRVDYNHLEEMLRQRGFANDVVSGIICRFKYKGITVDVMPTDGNILGFTNQWYSAGIRHKAAYRLAADGPDIHIFHPAYYVASKMEACRGRGWADLRTSQDFEDIVYVFSNRAGLIGECMWAAPEVRGYLSQTANVFLGRADLEEAVFCTLPSSARGNDEVLYVLGIFREMSML